jgi:hypothetical protein
MMIIVATWPKHQNAALDERVWSEIELLVIENVKQRQIIEFIREQEAELFKQLVGSGAFTK